MQNIFIATNVKFLQFYYQNLLNNFRNVFLQILTFCFFNRTIYHKSIIVKKIQLLLFIFTILFFVSCKKGNNNPKPITKADITGSVNLFDDGTNKMDGAGMTISIEGSDPEKAATTNTKGIFTLSDVPFGTYDLIYSKTGYGTYKIFGIDHSGGQCGCTTVIRETPSLGKKSTSRIDHLSASPSGSDIILSLSTTPVPDSDHPGYIRLFFHTEAKVSYTNYQEFLGNYEIKTDPAEIKLCQSDLTDMGFYKGSTVYVIAYSDSYYTNQYTDPKQNTIVFPNLNLKSSIPVDFKVQ
jgi:hypothetical protein